jgi:hypothetical protein
MKYHEYRVILDTHRGPIEYLITFGIEEGGFAKAVEHAIGFAWQDNHTVDGVFAVTRHTIMGGEDGT